MNIPGRTGLLTDDIPAVASDSAFQTLNIPDPDNVQCDGSLAQSDLVDTLTLAQGCYRVAENLQVPPFTRLTLDAGVMLKFAAGVRLEVLSDAALVANGTVNAPVVFTGESSVRGFWDGIEFSFSDSPVNLLRNTVVQYTGGGQLSAAVVVNSTTARRARIRMENSLVRRSSTSGLAFVGGNTVIESFFGNRVTENLRAGAFTANLLEATAGSTDYTGNDFDTISIPRNTFTRNLILPDPGIPVRSNGLTVTNASLTLGAGIEMLMDANSQFIVEGAFMAVGTADNPIILSARTGPNGIWNGLQLSGRGEKVIDHLVITDAGAAGEGNGAIELSCSDVAPASLSIQNTDISGSLSYGIALSPNGCTLEVGPNVNFFNNLLGDINR